MSWDSKSAVSRRRQNSSAASGRSRGLSIHARKAAAADASLGAAAAPIKIEPRSAHTSDPFLQEFLNPAFDPAEYLNTTLPPLQGPPSSSTSTSATLSSPSPSQSLRSTGKTGHAVPLAELSTEAQTVLTQLNAHTTRLTATLTQLTDDILRGGSRLAYEVELLRGEALGLAETLSEGSLRDDLGRFAGPAAMQGEASALATRRTSFVSNAITPNPPTPAPAPDRDSPLPPAAPATGENKEPDDDPPYISHLRTLTLVRSRLDSVIKTFGDAMEFVFPPSEISVSSGFLSVSAPDQDRTQLSTEEKGQQVLRKLREDMSALLTPAKGADPIKGVEAATRRVEELKELTTLWRGTAEEKGRVKFVEGLARLVEERHRELVSEAEMAREQALGQQVRKAQDDSGVRREQGGGPSESTTTESRGPLGGYGFMNQWQKIRGGL